MFSLFKTLSQDLRESLQKAEAALFAVAGSFGAPEECVQRWRDAAAREANETSGGDPTPVRDTRNIPLKQSFNRRVGRQRTLLNDVYGDAVTWLWQARL